MGLFSSDKPRVSTLEFKNKVRPALSAKGFTHKELEQLEGLLVGSLYEARDEEKGIDSGEVEQIVGWLRANASHHTFSPKQIDEIEATLRKHL